MAKLNSSGISKIILNKIENNIPILGVCVGFQVLFSESSEHGKSKGLNILNGKIINFKDISKQIKVPHVGWNECQIINKENFFYGINDFSDFYFTHSYCLKEYNEKNIISRTNYGINFVSAVKKNNVYGVQFHPEKSQSNGLKILKNFYERC